MQNIDVVVTTAQEYLEPYKDDKHISQIIEEDTHILQALQRLGLAALRTGWDDPQFDWSSTKAVLIRTTWNYAQNYPQFEAWLQKTAQTSMLINPFEIMLWNINKRYLLDMQNHGIEVVPTVYVTETRSLMEIMEEKKWHEVVVKPVVSAGAAKTHRLGRENAKEAEALFSRLVAEHEMMVQPFEESIVREGEKSCIIIAHHVSHALLKKPQNGDFRVQEKHGGKSHLYKPTEEDMEFVAPIVASFPEGVLYGRIDFVRTNEGHLALMELELLEPDLFFRLRPVAAMELAAGVEALLKARA